VFLGIVKAAQYNHWFNVITLDLAKSDHIFRLLIYKI